MQIENAWQLFVVFNASDEEKHGVQRGSFTNVSKENNTRATMQWNLRTKPSTLMHLLPR